jgi:Glycosyltransferases involved in cell wall biogenesis
MKSRIAAIILTFNEEYHLPRCIRSLQGIVDEVFVIDSYSKDRTLEIASELGAKVYQNPWKNYADQFNWALKNCNIQSQWVWRIDADEYLETSNAALVRQQIESMPTNVTGLYVKKKIVFMGKPLLHGGWFPVWHLKLWRTGKGECETRWMDEHIKLSEGDSAKLDCVQVDENLNDLTWWTEKHNGYATREMIDMLDIKYEIFTKNEVKASLFGNDDQRKRWLKLRYVNFPFFLRPLINFIYRYIALRGFLDGKEGLMWHFLQGFWYRFLVDAKIYELEKNLGGDKQRIVEYIRERYEI